MIVLLKLLLISSFVISNVLVQQQSHSSHALLYKMSLGVLVMGGAYMLVSLAWQGMRQPVPYAGEYVVAKAAAREEAPRENWLTTNKDGWFTDALGISKDGSSCNKTSGWRHPDCPPISEEQWKEKNKAERRVDLQDRPPKEKGLSWQRKTKLRKQARQESRELLEQDFRIISWAGGWGRVRISDVNVTVAHYPRGGRADVETVSFGKITKIMRRGNSRGKRIFNHSRLYIFHQTGRGVDEVSVNFVDDTFKRDRTYDTLTKALEDWRSKYCDVLVCPRLEIIDQS